MKNVDGASTGAQSVIKSKQGSSYKSVGLRSRMSNASARLSNANARRSKVEPDGRLSKIEEDGAEGQGNAGQEQS